MSVPATLGLNPTVANTGTQLFQVMIFFYFIINQSNSLTNVVLFNSFLAK
jgi:hypothetical protein